MNTPTRESSIVRLNIGGQIYITTKTTLLSRGENFFSGLFAGFIIHVFLYLFLKGRIPAEKDESGAFFIDRFSALFIS